MMHGSPRGGGGFLFVSLSPHTKFTNLRGRETESAFLPGPTDCGTLILEFTACDMPTPAYLSALNPDNTFGTEAVVLGS